MLDQVDQRLEDWAKAVVGPIEVSFEAPVNEASGHKIGIYLFEMNRVDHRVGGALDLPLKLELRYLITSWSQRPKEAHRALALLLFNAYDSRRPIHGVPSALARGLEEIDSSFQLDCDELPATFWTSFKCAPRPCFVLRVALVHEAPSIEVPIVQAPPAIRTSPPVALFGRVVAPNQTPISGATLEIPGLALSATTNARGEFRWDAVPSDPRPKEIEVRVKGKLFRHKLDPHVNLEMPLTIVAPKQNGEPT